MNSGVSTGYLFARDMVVIAGICYDSGCAVCCIRNLVPAGRWMFEKISEVKVLYFATHTETAARETLQARGLDVDIF